MIVILRFIFHSWERNRKLISSFEFLIDSLTNFIDVMSKSVN